MTVEGAHVEVQPCATSLWQQQSLYRKKKQRRKEGWGSNVLAGEDAIKVIAVQDGWRKLAGREQESRSDQLCSCRALYWLISETEHLCVAFVTRTPHHQAKIIPRGCQSNLNKDSAVNTAVCPKDKEIKTQCSSIIKWENPSAPYCCVQQYQSCNVIALEPSVKEKNSKGPQEQDRASSLLGKSPSVIIICGRSDAPHSCLLLPPS